MRALVRWMELCLTLFTGTFLLLLLLLHFCWLVCFFFRVVVVDGGVCCCLNRKNRKKRGNKPKCRQIKRAASGLVNVCILTNTTLRLLVMSFDFTNIYLHTGTRIHCDVALNVFFFSFLFSYTFVYTWLLIYSTFGFDDLTLEWL